MSGSRQSYHAEMTYSSHNPVIGFIISGTVVLAPGEIQEINLCSKHGSSEIYKSGDLLSIYTQQGFFTGTFNIGAHTIAVLTVR